MVLPIFFTSAGASSGALAGVVSMVCMVRVSSLMALLSPGGAAPSGKKLLMLTVYNVFRRLLGGSGVFLPEVLPRKEDRGAPFQDTVIDTGVGQVGRVLEFGQLQIGGDYHGPAAAVAAVNDEKHLLHRILGAALHTQIVNDEQVVLVKAGDKVSPILGKHPCQAVQNGGKVRHQHRHIPVKQSVGDTTGEKGLAGSHIPKQQQAGVVLVSLLPVLHIGACLVHQRILAVVVGKGVVVQIAVLQALGLPALDTLHAALPFLGGLALFLGLPLALADTAGHEVAGFPKAWHNGLPLAAAPLTVNEAVCRVYVLVPGQFHTGGCLVDQRPDFCGNLNHTVSSSFTL